MSSFEPRRSALGPASAPSRQPSSELRAVVQVLLRDVLLPYAVYLLLHEAGASSVVALAAAAACSAVLIGYDMVRRHRVNALGSLILLSLVLAIAVTLITGNARVALARDAVITAGLGVAFLVSLAARRPLLYHLIQSVTGSAEGAQERFRARVDSSPRLGSALRVASAVWGAGLLLDAAVRTALALTLPITAAATAITVLTVATVLLLLAWTRRYLPRAVG